MNKIGAFLVAVLFVGIPLAAQEEQAMEGTIKILDGKLGKGVEDREIVEEADTFAVNERVYLWLRVGGATDDSVTVIWKHGDHTYSTTLGIGGDPWRTWAYKTASMAGEWMVTVTDQDGNVLREWTFTVEDVGE